MIDINKTKSNLKAFMTLKGLPYNKDDLYFDGTIHRYSAKNNHQKDEFYFIHLINDTHFHCTFGTWRNGYETYSYNSFKDGEIENAAELIEEANRNYREKRQVEEKEAIENFKKAWDTFEICDNHPYLIKKKVLPLDLKMSGDYLYIPLYDYKLEVISCQRIFPDGQKRFAKGITTLKLFHPIGDINTAKELIFCEGWATAKTIYDITKKCIISCCSCHNILPVAHILKQLYPDKIFSLAIDNGKAGEEVKTDWINFINENVYAPDKQDSDFNDQLLREGNQNIIKIFESKKLDPLGIISMMNLEIQEPEKINDILNTGDISVLFAGPKVGKSRFAYEMTISAVLNIKFLKIKNYKKVKALYIDGELADFEIKKRCRDIMLRLNKTYPDKEITDDDIKFIRYSDFKKILNERMNLSKKEHQIKIEEIINPYDLLIFDSLGCVTAKRDTDSYVAHELDWRAFFYWLKDLKEKYQKTSLIIMHQTKSKELEGTQKILNDCDNFFQLKAPIDINKNAAAHFDFIYQECRSIPLNEKKNFTAKLFSEDRTLGKKSYWTYDLID